MVTISLVVAVIGCVLYLITATPKINEIGRIMFFAGLLALMLSTLGARVLV